MEDPTDASGLSGEGVYHPTCAPDKQIPAQDRRLREGGDVAIVAERPFQPQILRLVRCQLGHFARLESRVRRRWTPPVPLLTWRPASESHSTVGAVCFW